MTEIDRIDAGEGLLLEEPLKSHLIRQNWIDPGCIDLTFRFNGCEDFNRIIRALRSAAALQARVEEMEVENRKLAEMVETMKALSGEPIPYVPVITSMEYPTSERSDG